MSPTQEGLKLLPPTFGPWSGEADRAVAVLMSGGVDSSVAALLLKRQGWDVVGVTMRIPVATGCRPARPCCGWEAADVCRHLAVPHYFIDTAQAFEDLVIHPFQVSYRRGETPSPCVACNTVLKFDLVWKALEQELGVRHLATGHYARMDRSGPRDSLMQGREPARDQSYFLYGIPRDHLQRLHFPVGEYAKADIRQIAQEARLPTADRTDSMDLCFAGEGNYRHALAIADGCTGGPIVEESGHKLGRHAGVWNYTLGQRRGLGIASPRPLYVLRIDASSNTLIVGPKDSAFVNQVSVHQVNVLVSGPLPLGQRLLGRIRSPSDPQSCHIAESDGDQMVVRFDEPVFAPAPGQHLVLYDRDGRVVAGGVIKSSSEVPKAHQATVALAQGRSG